MKTILLGNGINIELGGRDYTNAAIIDRAVENIKTKHYSTLLFNSEISDSEFLTIFTEIPNILHAIVRGEYDKYCVSDEDKDLAARLKSQYSCNTILHDIGMEDFFCIIRFFHLKFNDPEDMIKSTHDGLCWVFLDAIYFGGRIQRISQTVLPAYLTHLQESLEDFDEIYTVNYDKTAESIAARPVRYLHGDFDTLLDQYRPDTLIGRYYEDSCVKNPVAPETEHIYCNGLMGFSGSYKSRMMQIMEDGQFGADSILRLYKAGMSIQDLKKLERLKNSDNEGERLAFGIINAKIQHPELDMHRYPMHDFRHISGELYVIGMSPNNDDHIWNAIMQNTALTQIVYFYHSISSVDSVRERYTDARLVFMPDSTFWGA